MQSPVLAPVHYRVGVHDLQAHLWSVELSVARPSARQVLQLPVWIPGSYLVREFAKQVMQVQASQTGLVCSVTQIGKSSWQIHCEAHQPLAVTYLVHAHDASVRTAWLDALRGFFNPTCLCMLVPEQAHLPHSLELLAVLDAPHWRVATALPAHKTNAAGFGTYLAQDYDELADSPFEMADYWSGRFVIKGIPHQVVVTGATASFDGARLLKDMQAICETQIVFWHGRGRAAHGHYVFLINAVMDGFGGLEHKHSTALICQREDLPRIDQATASDGYVGLLGLISHEYFHTWNVKRLRPAAFERYDYAQENHTDLLWFFEGLTSYYDDVLLCRAELISPATYLKLLGKTINQVWQTPGRKVHSVAQASFEAWTKYYRPDPNSANLTVSYYTKGALIGLCLDLSLRQAGHSLDQVMQNLWKRCKAGPMTEDDLLAVLKDTTGHAWQRQLKAWVHSTAELPVIALLKSQGVSVLEEPAPMAQQLGLRVQENHAVLVQTVLHDSVAKEAGLAPGDEWLGIKPMSGKNPLAWRLKKLEQLPMLLGKAKSFMALVSRDGQLLELPLRMPAKPVMQFRLGIETPERVGQWLADKPRA
ncbi:MAG: M61 family peptidase [Betaproteobacteria bacterium]|nr:M61 family peptidase [Betaproteobacteria bacterium]